MSEDTIFCKNCKKEVSASNLTVHTVHCTRNISQCTVCGVPVPRSQYQQHLQAVHATLDCGKCAQKIEADKIFAHEHEECPRRLVACQYCELEVVSSELQKHTDYCGARTDRCKGCTKYVQFRHLQFHYNSDHKYLAPEDKDRTDGADSGDDGGEECPVCLGSITLPLALECGHVFCMVCVKGIANTTKNCAICRRDIARDMLMDIRFCREEDIIKNYVNKPRDSKKTFRSHSVPSRVTTAPSARRVTTQDYDDMVSHLLSNRTSLTSVRYQRPNNTHTPASYTPYSYTSNTSTQNTNTNTTTNSNDDDCCCCSSSSTTVNSTSTISQPTPAVTNTPVNTLSSTTKVSDPISSLSSQNSTSSTGESNDSKPKRPTSLALNSSLNDSNKNETFIARGRRGPPPNATQEQYDRWLAFRVAQAGDDVSAAEVFKKNKPAIGRSQSMPERAIAAVTQRAAAGALSDTSDSSDDDEEGETRLANRRTSSSRPPASPRTAITQSSSNSSSGSANSSSYSSSSSLSASSRSPSLSKSSSDSSTSTSANGNTSASSSSSRTNTTGTRPKSSTGLKKRVSFKEEAPEERRVAPIMLPCEFCDEMFPERDLMRHQTSCDLNETQMPRLRRDSITSPPVLSSPTRSQNSPSIVNRNFISTSSAPNSNLGSPVSPTGRRKVPPNLPQGSSKRSESSKLLNSENHRTPPTSPPPRPPPAPHSNHHHSPSSITTNLNRMRSSPQPVTHDLTDSSSDSRPTSVSPCPPHSNNSYSSGISSMASSTRSVSSTPSSSSSASPIPAVVDTPTDIEADFEDDDIPFVKPRRGKLLSSAICSWRSMSGSAKDRRYTRSNTCPLEDTGDDSPEPNPIINSQSTSQLPPLPPRPESTPAESDQSSPDNFGSLHHIHHQKSKPHQQVFIKRHKKYRAPLPPSQPINTATKIEIQSTPDITSIVKHDHQQSSTAFRLDSKPMMNCEVVDNSKTTNETCEYCDQAFSIESLSSHKSICEMAPSNQMKPFRESINGRASYSDNTAPTTDSEHGAQQTSAVESSAQPQFRRYERAQSVLDDRCFSPPNRISRLERANSIKESTRSRPSYEQSYMGRRWSSRETLTSQRGESSSTLSPNSAYSGVSLGQNKYSSKGWSDHVSMVQDDVKAKMNSAKALLYGSSRYRSSSMARPALYSSSAYGSTSRLNSLDYRSPFDSSSQRSQFNITDSFGSAFRRRYVR